MNGAAALFAKALALSAGGLLATANLASANLASQPASTGSTSPIIASANYTVTYNCTAGPGCTLGNGYQHSYTMNIDIHGAITGSGTQTGYPQIQEKLSGALAQTRVTPAQSLDYLSTYDGIWFVGYTITETGSVDSTTGDLTGSAIAALAGSPQWDATFSVKGLRTSLTLVHGGGTGDCNRPGNSARACGHSEAPEHSRSANFTSAPTAPGQLARIDGTPAKANNKGRDHRAE